MVKVLRQQHNCVRDVSWHPYLNELVSSSWDRTVMKWTFADEDKPFSAAGIGADKDNKKTTRGGGGFRPRMRLALL